MVLADERQVHAGARLCRRRKLPAVHAVPGAWIAGKVVANLDDESFLSHCFKALYPALSCWLLLISFVLTLPASGSVGYV